MLRDLRTKLMGWLNYFRYAQMSSKLESIDGWIGRKLKCFRLKQCKRVIGMVRCLRKLGVEEPLSWCTALSGKGWWRKSNSPAANIGMNKMWFAAQGYYSLSEHYKTLHRNHFKETAVHVSTYGGVRGGKGEIPYLLLDLFYEAGQCFHWPHLQPVSFTCNAL